MEDQSSQYELWSRVDDYITEMLTQPETIMDEVLQANVSAGLPPIDVSPNQGKLLHLLAKIQGAAAILEIGTLGGYSTIWLAKALPENGRLISLEVNDKHAATARENIRKAGLQDKVEIRVGEALDSLARLAEQGVSPFDLVFIDADKPNNPSYLQWAFKLSRKGSLILIDNVVRNGEVLDESGRKAGVVGVRQAFDMIRDEQGVDATALQIVGSKGYDGLAIIRVEKDLSVQNR